MVLNDTNAIWRCWLAALLAVSSLLQSGCGGPPKTAFREPAASSDANLLWIAALAPLEISVLTCLLSSAAEERNEEKLNNLFGELRFSPENMSKEEYVHRLVQAEQTLVIEADSIEVVFLSDGKKIGKIHVTPPARGWADTPCASRKGQDSTWMVRTETLKVSFTGDRPVTHATVNTSVMVFKPGRGDTTRTDNSIFLERDAGTWVIASFENDLLELAETGTDKDKK